VALGDSLGTPYPTGAPPFASVYAGYAQADLATTVTLTNLSVGGWTSAQLLNAIRTNAGFQSAIAGADLLTFEIGGNDMLQANASYRNGTCGGVDGQDCLRAAIATFSANWDAILGEIDNRTQAGVIVRTMDLYDPYIAIEMGDGTFAMAQYYLGQINGHIHTTAAATGIPVAEVHLAYNGASGAEDPVTKGYISYDGLHPNAAGHTAIADEYRTLGYAPWARPDGDADGVIDTRDNCPSDANAGQENTDAVAADNGPGIAGEDLTVPVNDALGDACDGDDDNDVAADSDETSGATCGGQTTNTLMADTDGDHLLDSWECGNGSNPNDAGSKALGGVSTTDADGDSVFDQVEARGWGTSASAADSDGDGCGDIVEIGSVNGDRALNSTDLLLLRRRAAWPTVTLLPPEAAQDALLDANRDGSVNSTDVLMVNRWVQLVAPPQCPAP